MFTLQGQLECVSWVLSGWRTLGRKSSSDLKLGMQLTSAHSL